jgi:hypothetical protein
LSAATTLLRLSKSHKALTHSSQFYAGENHVSQQEAMEITLKAISQLWNVSEEALQFAYEVTLEKMRVSIAEFDGKFGSQLPKIYNTALARITNSEELKQCIKEFRHDSSSLITQPLIKSTRGDKGPTFLIKYTRINKSLDNTGKSYVLKWTNPNELAANRIFAAFSAFLSFEKDPRQFCGFLVPKATSFDFNREVHQLTDGEELQLSHEISVKLKAIFTEIAQVNEGEIHAHSVQIMLAERIDGENVLDFAMTKYKDLAFEEKAKFFQRLGRLAMLDLIFGNFDRLLQIDTTRAGEYCLVDYSANLGNVMTVWSPECGHPPILYAIDNGIEKDLIEDVKKRERYVFFLRTLMKDGKIDTLTIAKNIVASFKNTLLGLMDESSSADLKEVEIAIDPFSKDLEIEKIVLDGLVSGLNEMEKWLKIRLIPLWNANEASELQKSLEKSLPGIIPALGERFGLLINRS